MKSNSCNLLSKDNLTRKIRLIIQIIDIIKSSPKNYQEIFGDLVKDSVQFVNTSPLFHAANLVYPLMIVNGAKDRATPINEVDDFVSQLKKNGTEVEYLRFENAGHNIMNDLKLKIEVFKTAEAFFEKHLEKGK